MTTTAPARPEQQHGAVAKIVPLRHPGRWVTGAAVAALILVLIGTLLGSSNMHWPVVADYLFSPRILGGLGTTVLLTVTTMVAGVLLGIVLALMRLSANPVFIASSGLFVWFFRGVPPLVQIIFWFNLALLLPNVTIAVPFGPTLWQVDTNDIMTPLTASLVSLTLIEAAYSCEIVRAGIQSVNEGQRLAARSLGMSPWLSFRRVVLPQAMGVIIPPLGNDASGMLKTTALVSVIAMPELLYSAQTIYTQNYQVIPLLVVASIWYLVVTSALSIGQYFIERHYGRHRAPVTLAAGPRIRAVLGRLTAATRSPGKV